MWQRSYSRFISRVQKRSHTGLSVGPVTHPVLLVQEVVLTRITENSPSKMLYILVLTQNKHSLSDEGKVLHRPVAQIFQNCPPDGLFTCGTV